MTRPVLFRCLCLAWLLTGVAGCKWNGTSFSANSNGAIPMLNFSFVPKQSEPPVLPSGTEKAPDPIRQVAHEEDDAGDEEKVASKKTSSSAKLAGKEPDEDAGEDMLGLSDEESEPVASKSKKKSRGNPLTNLFKGKKKAPRVPLPRTDKDDDDEDEPDPRDKLNM